MTLNKLFIEILVNVNGTGNVAKRVVLLSLKHTELPDVLLGIFKQGQVFWGILFIVRQALNLGSEACQLLLDPSVSL